MCVGGGDGRDGRTLLKILGFITFLLSSENDNIGRLGWLP